MFKRSCLPDWLLWILILSSIFLLFYHLDKPLLWEDEGEVALIARNINKFGLPVTWDGSFMITQENGHDSKYIDGQYIWSWNTWLPYYAVALSFRLFGESTFTARLPFSLAGIFILFFYIRLCREINNKQPQFTIFCLLLLTTNVLFYLYIRQARYYAFSILLSIAGIYYFIKFLNSPRFVYALLYVFSLILNFHSNFVISFSMSLPLFILPAVLFLWNLIKQHKIYFSMLWLNVLNIIFLAQSIFWISFFEPAKMTADQLGFSRYWGGMERIVQKLFTYINLVNSIYFPLALITILLMLFDIYLFVMKKTLSFKYNPVLLLLISIIISHLMVISFFLQLGQKYLLTLIPVFPIVIGYILFKFIQNIRPVFNRSLYSKIIISLILLLFIFTNTPLLISERILHPTYLTKNFRIRSYFADYLNSLNYDYHGPVEGTVNYFKSNNIEQAVIYTDYETDSLKFYFPSFYFSGRQINPGDKRPSVNLPDNYLNITQYYIPRRDWGDLNRISICEKTIIKSKYKKHELNYYDLEWNNLPDLTYHKFFLDNDLPKLVIYEAVSETDFSACRKLPPI